MKRLSIVVLLVCGAALAAGQPTGAAMRPATPPQEEGPKGEAKLRWICKQLKLTDAQKSQAEALLTEYRAALAEQSTPEKSQELMAQIRDKFAEVQKARADGNMELARKLQEEMKQMSPGRRAEDAFFEGLEQALTPEQRESLVRVRAQAESIGDISLRPIHVLRAARALELTTEQQQRLEQVTAEFRTEVSTNPPGKDDTGERVEKYVERVRGLLTPAQLAKFNAEIEDLRGGAPPPVRVTFPAPPRDPALSDMQPGPPAPPARPTATPPPPAEPPK